MAIDHHSIGSTQVRRGDRTLGSKPWEDWREGPLNPAKLRSYSSEGGHVVHERIKGEWG